MIPKAVAQYIYLPRHQWPYDLMKYLYLNQDGGDLSVDLLRGFSLSKYFSGTLSMEIFIKTIIAAKPTLRDLYV